MKDSDILLIAFPGSIKATLLHSTEEGLYTLYSLGLAETSMSFDFCRLGISRSKDS